MDNINNTMKLILNIRKCSYNPKKKKT